MNDHPYMPIYFGDLLKQTLYWSGEERALLILLWAAQWWNGPLPLDLTQLAQAIQYNEKTFLELWHRRLHKIFAETPEGYIDQDLETRRQYAERVSGTRRAAGKASGKARRAQTRRAGADREPLLEQTSRGVLEQNEQHDVRTNAPTRRSAFARTPNQTKPNQTSSPEPPLSESPSVVEQTSAASSPSEPGSADPPPAAAAAGNGRERAPRRKRFPPDYPTEELRLWAREHTPRVNFDAELAMLRDHEFRDAHSDWDAVVRNWMRRAARHPNNGADEQHLTRFERHKRRLYSGEG